MAKLFDPEFAEYVCFQLPPGMLYNLWQSYQHGEAIEQELAVLRADLDINGIKAITGDNRAKEA